MILDKTRLNERRKRLRTTCFHHVLVMITFHMRSDIKFSSMAYSKIRTTV